MPDKLSAKIAEKIAALVEREQKSEMAIAEYQEYVRNEEETLGFIRHDLKLLRDLQADDDNGWAPLETLLAPAEAVKSLLGKHPEGLAQKEIVDSLELKIQSQSEDKRRLLYNTLFNLRKRGTIEVANGKIRLSLS
jgi:hypothetical protein